MTKEKKSLKETHGTPLVPDEAAALMGLEGKTLGGFNRVMDLLAFAGVEYPVGYRETLIQKYQASKVL